MSDLHGRTEKTVITGVLAALIFAASCISFPNGAGGYTHAGDAAAVIAIMTAGRKHGAAAAGIGAVMSDIILGYAMWAPFTLISKVLLVTVSATLIGMKKSRAWWYMSAAAGFAAETAAYACAAYFLEGGIGAALAEAGGMLIQSAVGIVLGRLAVTALEKSSFRKHMLFGDR